MRERTLITGNSGEAMVQHLTTYFAQQPDAFQHALTLQQGERQVLLEIDIDPGGGFESGYATTRFSAPVHLDNNFAFTIHPEGFLADFAKLFGLQDEVIGYPEFDEKVIIKTNGKEKVTAIFKDAGTRQVFATLENYTLQLQQQEETDSQRLLLLNIEEGITDGTTLGQLYQAFYDVLQQVETVGI